MNTEWEYTGTHIRILKLTTREYSEIHTWRCRDKFIELTSRDTEKLTAGKHRNSYFAK